MKKKNDQRSLNEKSAAKAANGVRAFERLLQQVPDHERRQHRSRQERLCGSRT